MENRPTFSLQWHITALCDQRCQHCYLFNSSDAKIEIQGSKKMNFNILASIADNFLASCQRMDVIPRFFLTGGDPILSPFFWDLLDYLNSTGAKVSLMGNPFHITAHVAQMMYKKGVIDYQMSLDGMETIHDAFRKKGSFRATFTAANILKSHGIAVGIMSTVSKQNAEDIPALTRLIVEVGIASATFARYCPNTSKDSEITFQPLEYRAFLAKMWKVYDELSDRGTRFSLKDHLWNLFLLEQGMLNPKNTNGIVVAGCGMAISHLTVLADGTVYACRRFKSPIGKVPEEQFDQLFYSQKMNEFRIQTHYEKCDQCELYTYCRGCPAVSHCITGSWRSADPQCWK